MAKAPEREANPPASLYCNHISIDETIAECNESLKSDLSRTLSIPADSMAPAVRHDAVRRRLKMRPDAQLIAHCTTHDEQSGWEASELCDEALEAVRGFVFAKHIISEPCFLGQSEGVNHSLRRLSSHIT